MQLICVSNVRIQQINTSTEPVIREIPPYTILEDVSEPLITWDVHKEGVFVGSLTFRFEEKEDECLLYLSQIFTDKDAPKLTGENMMNQLFEMCRKKDVYGVHLVSQKGYRSIPGKSYNPETGEAIDPIGFYRTIGRRSPHVSRMSEIKTKGNIEVSYRLKKHI